MPQIKAIFQGTQTVTSITSTTNGAAVDVTGALTFSAQVNADVNTPTNKTFAAAAVNVNTEVITLSNHAYPTGLKVQISNPGTLPTGISGTTDYFIINLTTSTFQLASTLLNAQAGTPINITAQGSGTNTVEVTALAGGAVKLQKSNDGTNWSDEGSATNITADAVIYLEKAAPTSIFMRLSYTLTAGSYSASSVVAVKGPN